MALIFQRLARNFIKNGYFPTDADSISRILAMLEVNSGAMRLIDPCCGEGIALAECAHFCREAGASVFSSGIEFNAERAANAKSLLDHVVHADFNDCTVSTGQFNLLWLNPPYGDRITDHMVRDSDQRGRDRWEKYFLNRSLPMLSFGGLLIFIIPHYVIDRHLAKQLARCLDSLSVYRLPEDQFKQIVVMGYRRKVEGQGDAEIINLLLDVSNDRNNASLLPEVPERFYKVSTLTADQQKRPIEIRSNVPTRELVADVISKHACLWHDFANHFNQRSTVKRRPVRKLSDWHLALMLAAGQVSGVVESSTGRQLLVKGGTHKEKEVAVEFSEDEDGNLEEKRIATDRFVPIIKAIDVTKYSPDFGNIFTIR
jgi:hypothetical protein